MRGAIWTAGVPGRGAPRTEDLPPADPEAIGRAGIDLDDPRTALVLALADDDLVAGHRSSHWTGVAPSLEEDIAFSGIAQDEINHADVWYQLLAAGRPAASGDDRTLVELLGLGRAPDQYRHAILCERPPRDFTYTIVRHWLYDHADTIRLRALADSSDPEIAAVAGKLVHEERYHLEHADTWMARLVAAGDDARAAVGEALTDAFPEALQVFEPTTGEAAVVEAGILPVPTGELLARWLDTVGAFVEEAGFASAMSPVSRDATGAWLVPDDLFAGPGGRHGVHTPDFVDDVWPEMTALYRAHPGARW